MKPLLTSVSIVAFTLSISSCGPLVYTNFGPNVPLLKEKGETSLSGAINLTMDPLLEDNLTGVSLTGATAVGKHVAIAGAFHYAAGKSEDDWNRSSLYWEAGGGWFKSRNGIFVTEVFAGAGFGYISNEASTSAEFMDIRYFKPYLQPSIGWRFKIIELGITSRFAVIGFTSQSRYFEDPFFDKAVDDTFVWEPAFIFRVGKAVKFQYQLSYSTFQFEDDDLFYSHNYFMSFGITARFSKKSVQ